MEIDGWKREYSGTGGGEDMSMEGGNAVWTPIPEREDLLNVTSRLDEAIGTHSKVNDVNLEKVRIEISGEGLYFRHDAKLLKRDLRYLSRDKISKWLDCLEDILDEFEAH